MANAYLLDTNVLVHIIREDSLGIRIRSDYAPLMIDPRPLICVVTEGELRSLAYRWNWSTRKREQMRFLLDYFDRAPLDTPVAKAYAVLDAHSEATGHPTGKNDVWIAATAHVTGRRLLTTDRDFDHLDPRFLHRDCISFPSL